MANYWKELLFFFVLELSSLVAGLLFVRSCKVAIDTAIQHNSIESLFDDLGFVVLSLLASFLTHLIAAWINEGTKAKMLRDLQNSIAEIQMKSQWNISAEWHTGDIMVRTISDCQEIVNVLGSLWITLFLALLRIFAGLIFLWILDSILALLIVGIIPMVLLSKVFIKKLRKINSDIKDEEGKLGGILQENLGNRYFLRSIGWDRERWGQVITKQEAIFRKKNLLLTYVNLSKGIFGMVMQFSFLIAFAWGTYRLHIGEITFGTMSAFLQLLARIQNPSVQFLAQFPVLLRFKASLRRVLEAVSIPIETQYRQSRFPVIDSLILKNVSFGYREVSLLKDISLHVNKGEPLALIGSSGKGKTTLLRMMMGLFPCTDGNITLTADNRLIPITGDLRCNFSFVPQGQKLVSGTILYNILGDGLLPDNQCLDNAIKLACAEFIYELPNGINTIVGEAGYGLSEGQAQRIGIARAILQNRSICLFDEITSALDKKISEKLISNLISICRDKILIVVTHDISVQNQFKNIYILP